MVDSFAEAAALLPSLGTRVLLTIGAKQLKHFAHLSGSHSPLRGGDRGVGFDSEAKRERNLHLIARILPSVPSLQQALAAGFTADRLLCLRPPFSRAFNRAILEEYQIELLVTKASGREGGVEEKVLAANDLGIAVLMINRPEEVDAQAVCTIDAAMRACQNLLEKTKP
jgi:precorrin-6A/cobalt-precorrin-6A reductase